MQQLRCAPLLILFGFLLSASCGDEQSAPTSGAAGLVIAVQGEASAKRGDEAPRPLTIDSIIYVKDTVKTGEGASLAIGFRHNNATWNVPASKEQAVVESRGWLAKRQSESPFAEDQKGSEGSGGRHTGKDGAGSVGTLATEKAEGAADGVASPAAKAPASASGIPGGEAASDSPDKNISETRPKPEKRRKPGKKPRGNSQPPMPDPANQPVNYGPRAGTTRGMPEGAATNEGDEPPKTKDKKKADLVRALARQCQAKHKGTGTLHYTLKVGNGKLVSFTAKEAGSLRKVVTCIEARLKRSNLSGQQSKSGSIKLD